MFKEHYSHKSHADLHPGRVQLDTQPGVTSKSIVLLIGICIRSFILYKALNQSKVRD